MGGKMEEKNLFLLKSAVILPGLFIFSFLSLFCFGATIHVPQDFPTIQTAINAAVTSDEIIVTTGTYYENINFNGKDIILRSTDPENSSIVENTIIHGQNLGSVVIFDGTETGTCVLSGFTITFGKAQNGGGIDGNGTLATIQDNTIFGNTGVGLYYCDGTIQNNTISENTACGISNCNGTIQNNTISSNTGIGLNNCDGTIQNNMISGNSSYSGGGLFNCNGTIQNNTISGNLAGNYGGGLCGCSGLIQNNTISGNSAYYGGGLWCCSTTIQNNRIMGNKASFGGGLYGCTGTIQNNTITDNTASHYGGGLYNCDGTIQSNTVSGNSSSYYGGGLYQCNGIIQNNTIWMNSAKNGGGLYNCDSGDILNNTIWNNRAIESGGGISDCGSLIKNCIIWGNSAVISGDQLDILTTPTYSCIQGWIGGGMGNISSDPKLLLPEFGEFHLKEDSPCIDAGGLITELTTDFEGDLMGYDGSLESRGDGSDYDMGADEYNGTVPVSKGVLIYYLLGRLSGISGDLNNDGVIDAADMIWLIKNGE